MAQQTAHGNEWPLFTVHITRGREYLRICSVCERFSINGARRRGGGRRRSWAKLCAQPIAENANSQHAISFTINSAVAFARLAGESYKPKLNITDFCSPPPVYHFHSFRADFVCVCMCAPLPFRLFFFSFYFSSIPFIRCLFSGCFLSARSRGIIFAFHIHRTYTCVPWPPSTTLHTFLIIFSGGLFIRFGSISRYSHPG